MLKRSALGLVAVAVLGLGVVSAQAVTYYANWTFNDGSGNDSVNPAHNLGGNGPIVVSPTPWGASANCADCTSGGISTWPNTSGWGLPTDNFTFGVWAKASAVAASNGSESSMLATDGNNGSSLWIGTTKISEVWNWRVKIGNTVLATTPTTPDSSQHIEVTRELGSYSVWLNNILIAGPTAGPNFVWGSFHVGITSGGGSHYRGLFGDVTLTDPIEHSPEASIKTFGMPGMSATINETAKTITWPVTYESDPANLAAEFTTSGGAIVYDADPGSGGIVITSGTARDFTTPVHYWSVSSDGLITNDYTVTVDQAPMSSDKDIVTFGPVDNPGIISGTNITWTAPYGTDLATLAPVYTTSPYFGGSAAGSPVSGTAPSPSFAVQNPATYTITAQDSSTKTYAVTVTIGQSPLVPGASGPVCWYDAALGTTVDGNGVVTWADQSGNGHTATRAQGTMQIIPDAINGLPAVQFGDNTYAPMSGNMYSKTQFIVTKMDGGDWGAWMGSQVQSGYMWNQGGNCWDQNRPAATSKNGTALAYPFYLGDNRNSQYMVLKIVGNDNNTSQRLYELGRQQGWLRLKNYMAEIIVYDRALSDGDANLVGGYLAAKYNVTTTYPAFPLTASVTSPADNQAYASGTAITATAAVLSGTGPYSVQFYLKTGAGAFAVAGDPVVGAGPTFDLSLGTLVEETYQIYADISDTVDGPVSSAINTFTVEPAVPTTTALATSGSPSTYGNAVTFTATVDPLPSGGTVQFYDDGNPIGTPAAVNTGNGTAQYTTTLLGVPSNSITADYSGHGKYLASSASPLTQTVDKAVLTVTADNKIRAPGSANPTFTYKVTGYLNGENSASAGITGAPGLSTLANTGSPEGNYAITCTTGDLTAANYSFTTVNGTLAVQAGAPPVGSGMACWYDASIGITEDGSGVLTWNDLSGNAHHATRSSGTVTLVPDDVNSRPAVHLRGGNTYLGCAGGMFTKEQYVVVRSPNATWNGGGSFLGRVGGFLEVRPSSYNFYSGKTGFWDDQLPSAVSKNGTVVSSDRWSMDRGGFELGTITDYMLLKITVNDNASAQNRIDRPYYQIGKCETLGTMDFDVAEIIGYDRALSVEEEKSLGAYFAGKYGLTVAVNPVKLDVSASGAGAEILNDGKFVEANHFGAGAPANPVVLANGLTFGISTDSLIRPTGPNFTAEWEGPGPYQTGWSHGSSDSRGIANAIIDSGFKDLMRSAWWVNYSGSRSDLEITGLTVGSTYRLQLISENPQDGTVVVEGNAPVIWSGGPSVLTVIWVATDDTLNMQYSRKVINRDTGAGQGGEVMINAYVLHDVTTYPAGTVFMIK